VSVRKATRPADASTSGEPCGVGFLCGNTVSEAIKIHAQTQHQESADDYHRVVAVLNARWRVIECRDGIQWILQRRNAPEKARGDDWRGRSYFRTREALIRCTCASAGEIDPAAATVLASLPERIDLPDNNRAARWVARHCRVSPAAARTIAEHAGIGRRWANDGHGLTTQGRQGFCPAGGFLPAIVKVRPWGAFAAQQSERNSRRAASICCYHHHGGL
jgi:hypothetical protein